MSTPAVVPAGRHAGGHGPSGRPAVVAALAVTQTVGYGTLYLVQAHTAAFSALTVHLVAALVSWGHRPTFAASVAGILVVPMTLAEATAPLATAALQATTGSYTAVLLHRCGCRHRRHGQVTVR